MKFLALLLVCCLAQDINGASVTIGSYINTVGKQIDALMADKQKQANAAAGSTVKLPTAPKLPTPNNPDQVIVNPPKPPLPNPKCDLKGLTALLKAMFGRVKGSCSNVKKNKGPLAGQCNAAKANFTTEFKVMEKVTENISYEFSSCSEKVNPAINDFVSNVGKIFDSLSAASTATDTKKCGKDVNVSVKNMAIMLKLLFESMNSITGSAKPAAGTNAADAVATSEVFLSNILLHVKVILDLVSSASLELSLESSEIVKTLSQTVEALSTKCADGKVKILGSVCIEFTASLTVIIKSESSVNLEELTEECTSIDTELGELTDSASEIEPPSSGETSAETPSSGETSAEKPSSGETSGETPSSGETSGETSTSPEETTEKPTSADLLIKISANIKVSIESITKSCGPLKTDVPAMGGKADASLSNVGAALTSLLSTIQSSGTLSVIELSTKIDAAIAAFIQSLTELINVFTSLKDSLSKDTSVAGTTAVSALDVIMKTIISISVKVTKATSVIVDKSNLFVTVTLDAVVAALGEINVESLDAKKTVSDLTEITSPKELNNESCTKVVEKLGKCSTEAVGKIKSKDSAKFNLRISFIFNAFGYTLQKLKVPKVCSGITSLQSNFSVLIKELFASLSCAEASKAEGGSAQDETKNGSGGSSPEKSSEEGADKKSKCKEIAPDRFKLVVTAILSILDASKSITADKSLDPKVLETFNQILKAFLTSVTEILTGLSTAVSEQTIDVSVLLSLSVEILTKATSGAEVDFGTLSTDVDGLLCYGNTVDTAKPALDDVKKIETDISKPEPAEGETKATFSKLSTSVSAAFTILSKSVTSFNKYYSTPVDAVGKAVAKISSSITAFIRKATTTTEVSVLLQDFLVEISLSIVELSDAYTKCSANTELDPKGYNAQFALNYVFQSTITIINSFFISFDIYITVIPSECTDFYTGVSEAVSAHVGSPDTDPSELGEKVKGVCNKFNKDKGGSNESGGDSNGSGGDDGSAGDEGSGAGTGSAGDEGSAGDGGSAGDDGSAGDEGSAGDGGSAGDEGSAGDGVSTGDGVSGED